LRFGPFEFGYGAFDLLEPCLIALNRFLIPADGGIMGSGQDLGFSSISRFVRLWFQWSLRLQNSSRLTNASGLCWFE
jgi:hypothetical protein